MNAAGSRAAASGRLPETAQAVVFDCDGLLVETESRWTVAETALFHSYGRLFGPEEKALLIGRALPEAGEAIAAHLGRPGAGPELAAELLSTVRQEFTADMEAMPGARELVLACRAAVPVAVASNSPRELVELALKAAGLADLFEHTVTVEDVAAGKPAPDLYLAACAALGADPARSVAFEDSATGAAAARAAGLHVAVVPSLPGTAPDHDWLGGSLADPQVRDWARNLRRETA
ncbi:HAD family hydrolase [Streptomyces durbertensis]|uniref:HAD family hydrolase n=1 Tax=Streptomyces durbertensis TaxID=2448886 RepID=UPI002B2096C3|nr:HAD family phosphatase [Streptomyces durbertensis]